MPTLSIRWIVMSSSLAPEGRMAAVCLVALTVGVSSSDGKRPLPGSTSRSDRARRTPNDSLRARAIHPLDPPTTLLYAYIQRIEGLTRWNAVSLITPRQVAEELRAQIA